MAFKFLYGNCTNLQDAFPHSVTTGSVGCVFNVMGSSQTIHLCMLTRYLTMFKNRNLTSHLYNIVKLRQYDRYIFILTNKIDFGK